MTHINCFPDEILIHIFSNLTPNDIQHTVSLVCNRWYKLSWDSLLSPNLTVKEKTPSAVLLELAARKPGVRFLKATRLDSLNDVIPHIVNICHHLVCLNIAFSTFDLDSLTIKHIAAKLHQLKHLNLDGCIQVDDSSLAAICSSLPHLEVINLSHCRFISEEGVIPLAGHITRLHRLNLDGVEQITNSTISSLVFAHSDWLDGLWLDVSNLSSHSFIELGKCSKLTVLCLHFCDNITDDGLLHLLHLTNLQVISLEKGSMFSSQALVTLFTKCKWQHLARLNLTECSQLDNSVVDTIVDLCATTLISLALNWCWLVTDPGIDRLVASMQRLEHLSLVGLHNITGTYFNRLPHLSILDLTQCNRICDKLLLEVLVLEPLLQIYNYYGELLTTDNDSSQEFMSNFHVWRKIRDIDICKH